MQYKSQRFSSQLLTSAAIFKAEAKLAKSDDVASAKRSIEIIMSHTVFGSSIIAFYWPFTSTFPLKKLPKYILVSFLHVLSFLEG